MKTSIAVAALGLVLAGAHGSAEGFEIIGSIENQAGGEMLMTDGKCGAKGKETGRVIMATGDGGQVLLDGCAYALPPGRLFILWPGGSSTILRVTPELEALLDDNRAPQGRPARVYR
jgi:hypothetical protein